MTQNTLSTHSVSLYYTTKTSHSTLTAVGCCSKAAGGHTTAEMAATATKCELGQSSGKEAGRHLSPISWGYCVQQKTQSTILNSCAASTENNDTGDDLKTIPDLGKGTTRLKHREQKYRKSAIFYGAMNSVIDASLFVNVTVKASFADVIFAIVWLGPKTTCYD